VKNIKWGPRSLLRCLIIKHIITIEIRYRKTDGTLVARLLGTFGQRNGLCILVAVRLGYVLEISRYNSCGHANILYLSKNELWYYHGKWAVCEWYGEGYLQTRKTRGSDCLEYIIYNYKYAPVARDFSISDFLLSLSGINTLCITPAIGGYKRKIRAQSVSRQNVIIVYNVAVFYIIIIIVL